MRSTLLAVLSFVLLGNLAGARFAMASQEIGDWEAERRAALHGLIEEGNFEEAEKGARELLQQTEQSRGEASLEAALVLDVLVSALFSGHAHDKDELTLLSTRAVELKRKHLGDRHVELAVSLTNLGTVCRQLDRLTRGREALEEALHILETQLGPHDPRLGPTLQALASVLTDLGQYPRAQEMYERDLAIARQGAKLGGVAMVQKHYNYARVLVRIGEFESASEQYGLALQMAERDLAADHPILAYIHLGLGAVGDQTRRLTSARRHYEEALQQAEARLGPTHAVTIVALNGLGLVLSRLGDYPSARGYYAKALERCITAFGAEHARTAGIQGHLADVARIERDFDKAIELNEQSLTTLERMRGTDHPEVATRLTRLALVYLDINQLDQAESLLVRALDIQVEKLGDDNPDVARTLIQLGEVAFRQNDFFTAEASYQRALRCVEGSMALEIPLAAEIVRGLAVLHAKEQPSESLSLALRAEDIRRKHLQLTIRGLPEREALIYSDFTRGGLALALSHAAETSSLGRDGRVWDALIRSRSLVLDEMVYRRALASHTGLPEIARLARDHAVASRTLANKLFRYASAQDQKQYLQELQTARQAQDKAEKALAAECAFFDRQLDRERVGLSDIQASLPSEFALVAMVRHENPLHETGSRRHREQGDSQTLESSYLAFVQPSGGESPRAVALGRASAMDSLVNAWRDEVSMRKQHDTESAAVQACTATGRAVRRAIWEPIAPHLGDAKTVLFVPDGLLSLINLAALPLDDGRYLIETTRFHYLSSERDIVSNAHKKSNETKEVDSPRYLVLGGPDFDAVADTPQEVAVRGARPDCPDFDELHFANLPGAREEALRVSTLLGEHAGNAKVTHLTDGEANETNLKRLAPGSEICHLATHGFFLGSHCTTDEPLDVRAIEFRPTASVTEVDRQMGRVNPLLFSGLALSGANQRHMLGDAEENGILTAEEAAVLNLNSVQWAVLSACDTGLGDIKAGEGVLGLRRAFQVAGAKTIIMSLWLVRDRATVDWMLELYRGRIHRQLDTVEAVNAASLAILNQRRNEGLSTHPFHWAGFVAAGDWR